MKAETRFRAMGTDVHVVVVGGGRSLPETARRSVEDLERRWSRFRPDSEISMLNSFAGRPFRVSSVTRSLIEHAVDGARITNGTYDPTVLGAVIRAGYDRTFERLAGRGPGNGSELSSGVEGIAIDPAASTVMLPAGVGFDPGGIGKGYAADLVVEELLELGAAGACVNVGGDLRTDGDPPPGGPWAIEVEHPLRPSPAALIGLRSGAVATSSRMRRTWRTQGDRRHHLIDPTTGRPAASGLVSATVVATFGWQAEILAKAAFLGGLAGGFDVLAATGAAGLLIGDDGTVHESGGLGRFVRTSEAPPTSSVSREAGARR
ncbi:MAG: FAD:protein FMN transferase [Actinomycetota bacterium]|nr:FAD:protein FMN transferase [Actinomycetota bacterium]